MLLLALIESQCDLNALIFRIIGIKMWIWEQDEWPNFAWDKSRIVPKLRDVRLHQGGLLGKMLCQTKNYKQSMLDTLLANIVH
ncbi:Fic family protein [Pseudoalteromonas luteoviolacea B = ATCC 29581]|nr:Fic family protein [Pseudoalteromonas luteoviolacea B = ATCC 29581]